MDLGGAVKKRQPARVLDHHIEHISMRYQTAAPIGTFVHGVFHHLDRRKGCRNSRPGIRRVPGRQMRRAPLRALRKSFCTTAFEQTLAWRR